MDKRPIALFDSGLGGLTVLGKIRELLPNENIIYFGDTARVPYGAKSKETITSYSKEIVNFLINKNVKLIIIACGTASSLAYDELINCFDIPIINVIEPTSKSLKSNKIGIIATKATIKSNAWAKAILKHHPDSTVFSKPCPLFVPIVEEGLANSEIADYAIDLYLKDFKKKKVESLILGCTHYPILYKKIKGYMGKDVKVVNINEYCIKEVKNYLTKHKMLNNSKSKPTRVAYVTDDVSSFKKNADIFCDAKFDFVKKIKAESLSK